MQGGAHYTDFFAPPDPNAQEDEDEDEEVDIRGLMKGEDSDLARGNNPFAAHDDDDDEDDEDMVSELWCCGGLKCIV